MSNPYAYYEDEPLPPRSRPLSVSSDGEEEPDMEPRYPIQLKGNFVAFWKLALKTYHIEVHQDSFECRLPNGEFVSWSREEARKKVEISGSNIYLPLSDSNVYCFRKIGNAHELDLARLKVWLKPAIDDPEQAYRQVQRQLQTIYFNPWVFGVFFIAYLILGIIGYSFGVHAKLLENDSWQAFVFLNGMTLARGLCTLLFAILLLMYCFLGKINMSLLRFTAIFGMVIPACFILAYFVTNQNSYFPGSVFFEIYLPCYCLGQYRRWRKTERQLQRENGLI